MTTDRNAQTTCPNCGTPNLTGSDFCGSCGANIASPQPEAPAASPSPAASAGGYPGAAYGAPQPASPPPQAAYGGFGPPPSPPPGYGQGYYPSPAPVSPFGLPYASWISRVGAYLLDVLVLGVVSFIIAVSSGLVIGLLGARRHCGYHGPVYQCNASMHGGALVLLILVYFFCGFVLPAIYFAIFNGVGSGQTLGMRAASITVRDANTGAVIGPGRSFLRFLVRLLLYICLYIPGLLSDLWPLWDQRSQTLADKAINTVVVRHLPYIPPPPPSSWGSS